SANAGPAADPGLASCGVLQAADIKEQVPWRTSLPAAVAGLRRPGAFGRRTAEPRGSCRSCCYLRRHCRHRVSLTPRLAAVAAAGSTVAAAAVSTVAAVAVSTAVEAAVSTAAALAVCMLAAFTRAAFALAD